VNKQTLKEEDAPLLNPGERLLIKPITITSQMEP
jgi:hypothetical protein